MGRMTPAPDYGFNACKSSLELRLEFDDVDHKLYLLADRTVANHQTTNMKIPASLTEKSLRETLMRYERRIFKEDSLKKSAVLVPIVKSGHGLELLFTKRTDTVEHHKGQVSFPGGAVEPGDATLAETALRETTEEIGLAPSAVSILGTMDDLQTPTGFIITPIVGYIHQLPPLRINNDEVAEIVRIPLEKFFDDANRRSEFRERDGVRIEVFFYDVWREPVWGATAFFVKRLVDLLHTM